MSDAIADLRALVRTFPSALLGYSGGVDSALLAVVLRQELGRDRMVAAIGRSASYPEAQWRTAREVAERFDVPILEVDTHELEDPNYLANPSNRCFYCKTELWSRLMPLAQARGLAVVCDGTNADDLSEGEHRPGRAAGARAGVRSPLAEVSLTKAAIRDASRPRRRACRAACSTDSRSRRCDCSRSSRPRRTSASWESVATCACGTAALRRGSNWKRRGSRGRSSDSRRSQNDSTPLASRASRSPRAATVGGAC